jgi:integral membrane sensor domain MASE1
MADSSIFISSCSRRQLARRRPTRAQRRLQVLLALVVLGAGIGAFVLGRVGI